MSTEDIKLLNGDSNDFHEYVEKHLEENLDEDVPNEKRRKYKESILTYEKPVKEVLMNSSTSPSTVLAAIAYEDNKKEGYKHPFTLDNVKDDFGVTTTTTARERLVIDADKVIESQEEKATILSNLTRSFARYNGSQDQKTSAKQLAAAADVNAYEDVEPEDAAEYYGVDESDVERAVDFIEEEDGGLSQIESFLDNAKESLESAKEIL